MRFQRGSPVSLAWLLAASGTLVGGAALIASGPVDASVTNVVCSQPVGAEDRLRVNLGTLEEVLARLRTQQEDADGQARPVGDGCTGDDRTGVDVEPPAQVSVRAKNLDAGPVAEISTKELQDEANRWVAGTTRFVDDTKDHAVEETRRTLGGAGTQVSEGVNQTVNDTYEQLPEGVRELLDSINQLLAAETSDVIPKI